MVVNTGAVLHDALSLQQDTSAAMRAKALRWFNVVAQKLAAEREWECLKTSVALPVTDHAVLLPEDFGQFEYAQSTATGSEFFLGRRHILTAAEFSRYQVGDSTVPQGIFFTATNAIFRPGTTAETVDFRYHRLIGDYADNADTPWPIIFRPLFMRAVTDFVYEYDADERVAMSYRLSADDLARIKVWDGRLKPKPKFDGYLRGR